MNVITVQQISGGYGVFAGDTLIYSARTRAECEAWAAARPSLKMG